MKVLRTFTALHSGSWPVVEAILRVWWYIRRTGVVYVVVFVAVLEIRKWRRLESCWKLRMQLFTSNTFQPHSLSLSEMTFGMSRVVAR